MSEVVPGLVWLVVLLAANAFFVGAEFAVVTARRSQVEPLADEGSRAARTTLWAMEHATLMLATSQLGITICSLLILNVSEPAIHHLFELALGPTGLSADTVDVVSFVVALLLVTFLHVVLGEMVPKNLSFSVPTRAALLLAPPLVLVSRVLRPVIWSLNALANAAVRLFGVEPKDEASSAFTLDEVAGIVEQSTREGLLSDRSGTLSNTFEFTEAKVGDVVVGIDELVCLPPRATPADVQRAVEEGGYSRYPVQDAAGLPVGYVHLKDVLDLVDGPASRLPIPRARIRHLRAIEQTGDLEDALAGMRRDGLHLVRAVDGAGATTGVLFLEDIIEVLVGEVQDATSHHESS